MLYFFYFATNSNGPDQSDDITVLGCRGSHIHISLVLGIKPTGGQGLKCLGLVGYDYRI